jgi:hypothetical protein
MSTSVPSINRLRGIPGQRGTRWRTGEGLPAVTNGDLPKDLYLDKSTGTIYELGDDMATYTVVANIKGPTGTTGTAGSTGQRGTYIFTSNGVPSGTITDPSLGTAIANDLVLDTSTGNVYRVS